MRNRAAVVVVLGLVALVACKKAPPVTVETWRAVGLRMNHPSTWVIESDAAISDLPDTRQLTLEGPHHGVFMLAVLQPNATTTASKFASGVAAKRAKRIDEKFNVGGVALGNADRPTALTPVRARIAGRDVDGVEDRYSIALLNADVPHVAQTFALDVGGHHVLVTAQTPAKDWEAAHADVQLMLDSLAADP